MRLYHLVRALAAYCLLPTAYCLFLVGCAAPRTYLAFFGRHVEPIADEQIARPPGLSEAINQGGDAITAEGSVAYGLAPKQVFLKLANHGRTPVRLSYVVDEYVATTFSGRTSALEKDDFLSYPSVLSPGDSRTVSLRVPTDLPIAEITQLIATINEGKTHLLLRPLNPMALPPVPPGARSVVARSWASGMGTSSASTTSDTAPHAVVVPEPSTSMSATHSPPIGMVPVEVEFQQVLGSSLTADVYWDDGEVVTLGHGDRQLFYVAPGPHAVHVASRVASMERTAGQVPVVVGVDRPTRIVLEAQARFSGVDVRIRVWQGERVVLDRVFTPGSHG